MGVQADVGGARPPWLPRSDDTENNSKNLLVMWTYRVGKQILVFFN